jgi:SOS-response transcriptional repressor LexA
MSLIVGFSKTGLDICFSNQYAAKLFNTSERTISRTITDLIDKKYITYYKTQTRRILYLKKEPEILNLEISLCDIDNSSTQDRHNDYTGIDKSVNSIDKSSTPSGTFVHTRIDNVSTNNIDNKIDNKIVVVAQWKAPTPYSEEFISFVEKYKEGYDRAERAYIEWNELSDDDMKLALESVESYLIYLQRKKTIKYDLDYYLKTKPWTWSTLKGIKKELNKTTTTIIKTKEDKAKEYQKRFGIVK